MNDDSVQENENLEKVDGADEINSQDELSEEMSEGNDILVLLKLFFLSLLNQYRSIFLQSK